METEDPTLNYLPRGAAPVTAVIPCFRSAATLHRAVSSVFAQSIRPTEVIVVDDASDDEGTKLVLTSIEAEFSGLVKVIRLEVNGGASVARNRGWEAASQPFIAFLDADDAWHPNKLAMQMPLMVGADGAAVSGHSISINTFVETGAIIDMERQTESLGFRQLLFRNRLPTPSVIVRRSLSQRFDPSRRLSEDYDLWLRIVAAGEDCKYLAIPLTTTFKASYGEGGLSQNLWAMERAQASVYRGLMADRLISPIAYGVLTLWGWARFGRRLVISSAQRLSRSLQHED